MKISISIMFQLQRQRCVFTHSCRNLDRVFSKLLGLLHHGGREVSNDAHLVHIALTVHLPGKIAQPFLTHYHTAQNAVPRFQPFLLDWCKFTFVCHSGCIFPVAFVTHCTYTSRPEDSSALLWYEFRIHINHLTLPHVDESAVRSYEVIQGYGHGENI